MVLHHWMQRVCSELKYPTFEGKEKRSVGTNLQSSPSTLKLSCRTIIVTSCDEPHKKSFYKFYINIIYHNQKNGSQGKQHHADSAGDCGGTGVISRAAKERRKF